MHTCPMCMGAPLPIIPPAALNVFIGGLIAARMTDLCTCVAPIPVPVDAIIFGSPTVLIGKLPAARMTDPTVKGGMILPPCCPTVMIGMAGFADPTVIVPGVLNLVCGKLQKARDKIKKAKARALMAGKTYTEGPGGLPAGVREATQADLQKLGLHDGVNDMTKIRDSDFGCKVFVETDPVTRAESYVVAFKGTTPTSPDDWGANLAQALGMDSAYYNQAMLIGQVASEMAPGTVHYVGHSLGGGMASAAAAVAKSTATTFNAAGVNPKTVARRGKELADAAVDAYFVDGDILSGIQDTLPVAEAVGHRIALPPAPETMATKAKEAAIGSGAGAAVAAMTGPLGGVLGGLGVKKVVEGVRKHGMDEVVAAIDQEADKIQQEMIKAGCI
jgi:uncharacterized Zn-binding protein involved in type VI secretion